MSWNMKVDEIRILWNKIWILRNMKVNKIEILTRHVSLREAKIEIIEIKYFTDSSLETKYNHQNINSRYITNRAV